MKILVTGGAGYKGVVLVQQLLERGHEVALLDNFMYGCSSVLHLAGEPRLTVIPLDLRNAGEAVFSGYDVVYHLAGISGMPACAANPHTAEMVNVEATRKLVKALSKQQCVIYASTTSFYGANGAGCDETVPVEPVSLYGKTKYQAECIVQERENSVSLRFATVFGVSPRMRVDLLVNDFTYKAVNDRAVVIFAGRSKRTFLHIRDAIGAYLFTVDHWPAMRGGIFNVGTEQLNLSKVDIAEAIRRQVKYEIIDSTLPDLDVRNFLVSFEKIHRLGYRPSHSLDDGVSELIKLYGFYHNGHLHNIL